MAVQSGQTPTNVNLNDTTPAAIGGYLNVAWQAGDPYTDPNVANALVRDVSAQIPNIGGVRMVPDAAYTLIADDAGRLVILLYAGAVAVTIPSPTVLTVHFRCVIANKETGNLTLTPSAGMTIDGLASLTLATGGSLHLYTDGANYFTSSGAVTSVGGQTGTVTLSSTDLTDGATLVHTTRLINTTAPLTGGGDLSTDRTLAIDNFTGDTGTGGTKGAVPAPASGDGAAGKFLKADGIWVVPAGTATGTVTSVALTMPSDFTVGGSPVTSSGTLAVTANTQTANTVKAGPTTGSAAAPTYRALVAADIPNLDASKITSGTLNSAQLPAQPVEVVCFYSGKPAASARLLGKTATFAHTFAGNLVGSQIFVGTNPASTATYTFKKNGSSCGTLAISTIGGATWTTTSGASVSFAVGDYIEIIAPSSQDTTLSDVGISLYGTR